MNRLGPLFRITIEEVEATGGDLPGFLATNDDLGLVVEADSFSELMARVRLIAPDLYALNIDRLPPRH